MTGSPLPSLAMQPLEEAELTSLYDAAPDVRHDDTESEGSERRRDNPHHFSGPQFAGEGRDVATDENADAIAVEHIRWCQSQGMTPRDIVKMFGHIKHPRRPTFDDAVWVIAAKWIQL